MRLLFLKFRRSETELDWNYPFDFCGSIYRLGSVEEVIAKIEPQTHMLKPNTFEFAGNKAIKFNMLAKTMPYSLCLNWPAVTVITVNKVQDIYNTPTYNLKGFSDPDEETKEQTSSEDDCLLQMNQFFRSRQEMDTSFYAR